MPWLDPSLHHDRIFPYVLYMRLVYYTTYTSEDAPFGEAIKHTIVWAFHVLRRYFCNIRAVFLFRYGILSVFISKFLCVFSFLLWSFVHSLLSWCTFCHFVLIYSSVGTFVVFIYLLSLLLFWFTVLSLLFYITIITTFILAYSSVGSYALFWGPVAACYRSAFMQCTFCFTDTEK